MLQNYLIYLNLINKKLQNFFENQKSYIACKQGCAKCCKNAEFPYTEIEFKYLLEGYFKLPKDTQLLIMERICNLEAEKEKSNDDLFRYDCPFLINNSCSVYEYRGLMCRCFGLMTFWEDNAKTQVPFCAFQGLNYSNVVDFETKTISQEKFEKLGFETEPKAFNVSYKALTDTDFEESFKFKFGEKKALLDWFKETK